MLLFTFLLHVMDISIPEMFYSMSMLTPFSFPQFRMALMALVFYDVGLDVESLDLFYFNP